jgi:hypothetical protein
VKEGRKDEWMDGRKLVKTGRRKDGWKEGSK